MTDFSRLAQALSGLKAPQQESLSEPLRKLGNEPLNNNTRPSVASTPPPKEEKPSYNQKHKLTHQSWDENVEAVKVLKAKVNDSDAKTNSLDNRVVYLEKVENHTFEIFECINERLKRMEQETWQAKLIHAVYSNKIITFCYLAMILGIVVGIVLIIK